MGLATDTTVNLTGSGHRYNSLLDLSPRGQVRGEEGRSIHMSQETLTKQEPYGCVSGSHGLNTTLPVTAKAGCRVLTSSETLHPHPLTLDPAP